MPYQMVYFIIILKILLPSVAGVLVLLYEPNQKLTAYVLWFARFYIYSRKILRFIGIFDHTAKMDFFI